MTGIAHVRGPQAAPFYAWVREQKHWEPNWNFNKVLIGRDGRIVGTFGSGDEPGARSCPRRSTPRLQSLPVDRGMGRSHASFYASFPPRRESRRASGRCYVWFPDCAGMTHSGKQPDV